MFRTKRLDNESELSYIWRICSAKDEGILERTWDEVADILNDELSEELSSSAYRKKYQSAKAFYNEVFSKMDNDEELMEKKRELERLRIMYRDDRNAWNKQNYADARVTQKLDYLEDVLTSDDRYTIKPGADRCIKQSDNDLFIMLSDLHIGQTFDSVWGCYNTDIAAERLGRYLANIDEIRLRHGSENAFVSIQGDLISGSTHKSLQVTNRENVIEQIKIASDFISDFLYELSTKFENVIVSSVAGNHSRIDKKDDALHDERLDDLITWIAQKRLCKVDNIGFVDNDLDNGISCLNIRDNIFVNVHGDYDSFSKNGVSNLCMMLGSLPYAVTFGHLHTCAVDECNGVKMIRGGSLAGSGDSYTIEKRLSGKPSQMVCVVTRNGIEAYYPVEL